MGEDLKVDAAFFSALGSGAVWKTIELARVGASQERLDAQQDLAGLLHAVAKKWREIEALDAAQ